jgi:hypothetical protein
MNKSIKIKLYFDICKFYISQIQSMVIRSDTGEYYRNNRSFGKKVCRSRTKIMNLYWLSYFYNVNVYYQQIILFSCIVIISLL